MTTMRSLSQSRILSLAVASLLLALSVASAAAAATRDVAMQGPNGDGGGDCSATEAATPATAREATDAKASKPAKKPPATRIKPIVPVRGGDDSTVHAPRWHSFLPGMFR